MKYIFFSQTSTEGVIVNNITMPKNGFYLTAVEWILLNAVEYLEIARLNSAVSKLRRLLALAKKVKDQAIASWWALSNLSSNVVVYC